MKQYEAPEMELIAFSLKGSIAAGDEENPSNGMGLPYEMFDEEDPNA